MTRPMQACLAILLLLSIASVYSQTDLIFADRYAAYVVTRLNDTGIDECSDGSDTGLTCPVSGVPNQDADVGRDYLARTDQLQKVGNGMAGFDFTKISSTGEPLDEESTEWACILDNHTGLIWEVKTTDGGLHDRFNTYTWYNPDAKNNGGEAGVEDGGDCEGSLCDTHHFAESVNSNLLCGIDEWRLPKIQELVSIIHYGAKNPSIDTTAFKNAVASSTWSSTSSLNGSGALIGGFFEGGTGASSKDSLRSVRLVARP